MHKCPSCNRSTDEAKFSPKVYPNTLCRDCDNKRAQEYRRSYDGMTKTMYNGMVKNSKDRRMALPNFTRDELCVWRGGSEGDAFKRHSCQSRCSGTSGNVCFTSA